MLGVERVRWRSGRLTGFEAVWTRGDSNLATVRGEIAGDTLRITGTSGTTLRVPAGPWAVADYGMEDQLLPALASADSQRPLMVVAYRPFAAKWDTLTVTRRPLGDATVFELLNSDGKRDHWLVARDGTLIRLTREGQKLERRPLEATALYAEYQSVRERSTE
jgi:hypothetical protein